MKRKFAMLSVSLTVLMTIFFVIAHYIQTSPRVVILDKDRLISAFVRQLSAHNVSDRLLRLKTNAFRDAMTHSITLYAQKNNVLILDKKQALAGGVDITTIIEQDISLRMREMK
jgi:hypothetical protein